MCSWRTPPLDSLSDGMDDEGAFFDESWKAALGPSDDVLLCGWRPAPRAACFTCWRLDSCRVRRRFAFVRGGGRRGGSCLQLCTWPARGSGGCAAADWRRPLGRRPLRVCDPCQRSSVPWASSARAWSRLTPPHLRRRRLRRREAAAGSHHTEFGRSFSTFCKRGVRCPCRAYASRNPDARVPPGLATGHRVSEPLADLG